jgi:hypothetical protein
MQPVAINCTNRAVLEKQFVVSERQSPKYIRLVKALSDFKAKLFVTCFFTKDVTLMT